MNQRDRDALDRHITGNYGEDQFPQDDPTDEQIEQIRSDDLAVMGISTTPTQYAIICREHSRVYLTREEYLRQMNKADERWRCPHCWAVSTFDDDTYDEGIQS